MRPRCDHVTRNNPAKFRTIVMKRSGGPFSAQGYTGEVGDFYRCYRCDNRVTIMTTIDPGEESET